MTMYKCILVWKMNRIHNKMEGKRMKSKKGNVIQKISILAALAMLICMALAVSVMANETTGVKGDTCYTYGDVNEDGEVSKSDAIYLLYHSVNEEEYPLEQNGDFDGDNEAISGKDALYLLGLLLDTENFSGEVHAYAEPIWTWNQQADGSVYVTAHYKCACGEKEDQNVYVNVEVEGNPVSATCTETGSITYNATAEFDGVSYTTSKTFTTVATGHSYDANEAACVDHACQNEGCTYEVKGSAHVLGEAIETVVDAAKCEYKEVYTCTECREEVDGKTYEKHTYKAAITTEANCQTTGVKTYTCSTCNDSYTETIPANADAHIWNNGTSEANVTTYACTVEGCTASRTTINASTETEATVTREALADVDEVELKNAAIKLDNTTLGKLSGDVKISAETTDVSNITNLASELAAQIGENPVYDFSMTADGNQVSDFGDGKVTITIPYTLQEGDDADCIDVWYINDDGEVEVVKGTYNNGYVTFQTSHFSYYTVTRLTPAQRCEAYGHSEKTTVVAPTCETDGYTLHVCVRCSKKWTDTVTNKLGHDYTVDEKAATCTENGYYNATCNNCGDKKAEVLVALGHDYKDTTVDATCETRGYVLHECKNCDYEEIEYATAVAGHDYKATWNWDKENLTANLSLICQREECGHSTEKAAVVGIEKQIAATCDDEGYVIYTAQIKYNGTTYNDSYTVTEAQLEHKVTNAWQHNSLNHYKVCTRCNARLDETAHTYGEGVVTKVATCTDAGEKTLTCVCGYETVEAVPALGHNLVEGSCTRCDFTTITCNHEETTTVEIELAEVGGCDGWFVYKTCECGQNQSLVYYDIYCDFEEITEITKDENGYEVYHVEAECKECGLHYEETSDWEITADCIGTSYMQTIIQDKDGNVIVDFDGIGAEDVEHPQAIRGEAEDLTQYGVCGELITHTSCPCGQYESVSISSECAWEYVEEESQGEAYVLQCEECGLKRVITWDGEEIDDCHYKQSTNFTYYVDDVVIGTYTANYLEVYHYCEYTFTLKGDDCSDGYIVNATCKNCNYTGSSYEKPEAGQHFTYYQELDLSAYDLCTDTAYAWICPCGEYREAYLDNGHESLLVDLDEEVKVGNTTTTTAWFECELCDLEWESKDVWTTTDHPCITYFESTCVYKVNGEEIFAGNCFGTSEDHEYKVIAYEVLGEDCYDGARITYECQVCGKVDVNNTWGHMTFELASYDLADYGFCGGTVRVFSCACGEQQWLDESPEDGEATCQWMHWSYNDETETRTYKCSECGMYRQDYYREKTLEGCMVEYIEQHDYMSEYDVLVSAKMVSKGYNHNFDYEYQMNGTVCSDGYYTTATCKACRVVDTWYSQPEEGEHWEDTTESYDLADYGFCRGEIWKYECPCGQSAGINYNYECQWMWYDYDEEIGTDIEKCIDCGGYRMFSREAVATEGCYETYYVKHVLYDTNMVEKLVVEGKEVYVNHNSTYTIVLDGTACSDGYTITEICSSCGYTDTWYNKPPVGEHHHYEVESYDMESLGLCDGKIRKVQCPCGEDTWWNQENGCAWNWTTGSMNSGEWECLTCGAKKTEVQEQGAPVGCYIPVTVTTTLEKANGEIVLSYVENINWDNHDYEVISVVMNGTSCEDGFVAYITCTVCGVSIENYGMDHQIHVEKEYDLTAYNACEGGEISLNKCYCGENQYLYIGVYGSCSIGYSDNEYVDETGIIHDVTIMRCYDCGLLITDDAVYDVNADTCMAEATHDITISVGEQAVDAFTYSTTQVYHEYVETVALQEGSTSCEDGIIVTNTCKNCGISNTSEGYGHRTVEVTGPDSRIDLSQYGAVCGGYLVHKACVCGEYNQYEFNGECDLGWSSTTPWIEGDFDGQYTTEGWVEPYFNAYNVKCAVTNPQCGLSMRQCRYYVWNEDNCSMQEYIVWQIGYDAETDTYQKEVTVTGDTFAYHDYVESTSNETTATGGTKYVTTQTCLNCLSTRVETREYDADGMMLLNEELRTNTLENGEVKEWHSVYEYVVKYDYQYESRYYYSNTYADGRQYWYSREYIYDWDNFDCTCTYKYSDSYGQNNEEVQTCHVGDSSYVSDAEPTCSQFGAHHYERVCLACGETEITSTHSTAPAGHNYGMIDDQTGMYTCTRCGLQSANGADGSILLEDMTEAYGNGVNYVIGYFNRSGYQFNYYVGVVTEDNEVILSDITFTELRKSTDGINAISFSKADVAAAMEAAGVTTGDIRLTFVPADAGSDLDYAITLTE